MPKDNNDAAICSKKSTPCHTCRRQRLRCDASQPTCKKCVARGVECLGYGTQPILWVQPRLQTPSTSIRPAAISKVTECQNEKPAKGGKKGGRPKLVLMDKAKIQSTSRSVHDQRVILKQTRALQRSGLMVGTAIKARQLQCSIAPSLDPIDYHDQRLILETMNYYNDYICPDLVLLDTVANPHRFPLVIWCYIPDFITDLLIFISIAHQVIRSQSFSGLLSYDADSAHDIATLKKHHLSSFHHKSIPLIYKHQHRMLNGLNQQLSDPEASISNEVFSVVVTLMLTEIQQSAFGAWPTHMEAARIIIAKRGGISQLFAEHGDTLKYPLSIFILFDIMNFAMAPSSVLNGRTALQLEYLAHLQTIFRDGVESGFPCPNELLAYIIRINHVRYLNRTSTNNTHTINESLARQVLCQIVSFSPPTWARRHLEGFFMDSIQPSPTGLNQREGEDRSAVNDQPTSCESPPGAFTSVVAGDRWEDLAKTFQYAVLIYCIRTLFLDRGQYDTRNLNAAFSNTSINTGDPAVDLEMALDLAMSELLSALHQLWAYERNDPSWCGKFTAWPLLVAGLEMRPGPAMEKEKVFIRSSLCRLCLHLGTLSPLDAIRVLQSVWRSSANGEERCSSSWDDRLGLLDGNGLLIF